MAKPDKPYIYGFDLDNTLDNNSDVAHLARALGREGHKIYIITASNFSKKAIKSKLYGLNIPDYEKVIKVTGESDKEIGEAKGDICNKYGVSLYFDNKLEVLRGVSSVSKVGVVHVLAPNELEPESGEPARSVCRCELELRDFKQARCMHCEFFYETADQRREHSRLHHCEREGVNDY